jgi:hypothetical protein
LAKGPSSRRARSSADSRGISYLLEHRISDVTAFLETVRLVGEGGTVIDPEVVPQLLTAATAALTSMH